MSPNVPHHFFEGIMIRIHVMAIFREVGGGRFSQAPGVLVTNPLDDLAARKRDDELECSSASGVRSRFGVCIHLKVGE